MVTSFYRLPVLPLFFFSHFLPFACSLSFDISTFVPNTANIYYHGDAMALDDVVEFNKVNYLWRVGWVTYGERVLLWDNETGKLTDFDTHFSFTIPVSHC